MARRRPIRNIRRVRNNARIRRIRDRPLVPDRHRWHRTMISGVGRHHPELDRASRRPRTMAQGRRSRRNSRRGRARRWHHPTTAHQRNRNTKRGKGPENTHADQPKEQAAARQQGTRPRTTRRSRPLGRSSPAPSSADPPPPNQCDLCKKQLPSPQPPRPQPSPPRRSPPNSDPSASSTSYRPSCKPLQRAVRTPRRPRHADLPPMVDNPVAEVDPLVPRNHLHQVLLHLHRIRLLRQLQPPRDAAAHAYPPPPPPQSRTSSPAPRSPSSAPPPAAAASPPSSAAPRPPNRSTTARAAPWIDFDLFRKNPVVRITSSSSGREAAAIAAGVGYIPNSVGVTRFTRASVHCADRIVATVSSHAFRWFSAHTTSGYVFRNASRIAATRSGASGFTVLPTRFFLATGSVAAIARAASPSGEAFTRRTAFTCFFNVATGAPTPAGPASPPAAPAHS